MLRDATAFSSFTVDDVPRAKEFYGTTLGLEVTDAALGVEGADVPAGLDIHLGAGTRVGIYPKPDHQPATFTVLSFPVDDVDKAVDRLVEAGVTMQRYDGFGQDDRGVARGDVGPAIAWFTDPAGNVLAVLEQDEDD